VANNSITKFVFQFNQTKLPVKNKIYLIVYLGMTRLISFVCVLTCLVNFLFAQNLNNGWQFLGPENKPASLILKMKK